MTNKATKYGLMTIAAVLLVALAFAGAASAVQITADQWNALGSDSALINGNASYEFKDGGIIYPKFNGSTYDVNRSITFDFTNYTGTFYGEPGADTDKKGALFGWVQNTTYAGTVTIKNLTLTSVNVTPTGSYQNYGGIIGYFKGKDTSYSKLNFTNCTLVNCSIGSISGHSRVGGLIGMVSTASMNVTDCKAKNCSVVAGCVVPDGSYVGGLAGYSNVATFENVRVEFGNVSATSSNVGGMIGAAKYISLKNCTAEYCVVATPCGGAVGGLVGYASYSSYDICKVANSSISSRDENNGGLVGGSNEAYRSYFMNGSSVTNCIIVSSGGVQVGGLVGRIYEASEYGITECVIEKCTILSTGGDYVGGLVGNAAHVPNYWIGNKVINCAINGSSTNTNIVCGNRPEMENPDNCTVTGNYIRNQSGDIPQPQITLSKNSDTPSSDITAITVTKLSGIGTKNNLQYACGYVIDSSLLEFNPLNGTEAYSSIIKVGMKDTFAVPADVGYTFNGWNISSVDGTNLTNAAGELLSDVTGYTNATGYWNNVSGTIVELYANRTAIEYNNSVTGGVATFGNGLPVVQVIVGSANPNITNVSFKFMGAPADISTKPSGYKSIATINDAFNLSINGTQDADVTVVFNATGSDTIFLAHNKTGNWEFLKATATGVAGQYKAIVTKESGFSPFQIISAVANDPVYTPSSSSKQTGSTIILSEGQTAPTAYATATPTATPTVKPTEKPATPTVIATEKPTTQATQSSPAPFVGILAGLGVAALVLRLRK